MCIKSGLSKDFLVKSAWLGHLGNQSSWAFECARACMDRHGVMEEWEGAEKDGHITYRLHCKMDTSREHQDKETDVLFEQLFPPYSSSSSS